MSATDPTLPRLSRLLVLLDDPAAGPELHAAYAPGAPIYVEHTVRTAGDLDAAAFAVQHKRAVALADGRAPRVRELRFLACTGDVAWYEGRELESGRTLTLAAGWEGERLAWLTLAPARAEWDLARGRLETVSNYLYGEPAGLATPRSWLDLAYHGLYAHEDTRFESLDDARFSCHMSGGCCNMRFEIRLPATANAVLASLPFPHEPLPVTPQGELLLKRGDGVCQFLDERQHCRVHAALGKQVFATCARYPFHFAETPDAVHVSTQPSCVSARANLGAPIVSQTGTLRRLLAMRPRKLPSEVRLRAGEPVEWEPFLAAETALVEALERRDQPLWQRLWAGAELVAVEQPDAGPASDFERLKLDLLASPFMLNLGLPDAPLREPLLTPHAQDEILADMGRNVLYSKKLGYTYDLAFAFNTVVLMAALAAHARARTPDDQLNPTQLRELGVWFMHDTFMNLLASEDDMGVFLRTQLADPAFAPPILRALAPAAV